MRSVVSPSHLLLLLGLVACGIDDRPDRKSGPRASFEDPCDAYKQSYCAYLADCGLLATTRGTCEDHIALYACKDDAIAEACSRSLWNASCDTPSDGCTLRDIVDPAPAVAACGEVQSAICRLGTACGVDDAGACNPVTSASSPCESVVAPTRPVATCLGALETAACDAGLPEDCDALFYHSESPEP